MHTSSETVTQKAFSDFNFLIHWWLFCSTTEKIICSTRQHGAFAKNLKTSSFGISSFSLFSWPLVWLKLFFVLFKSSMDLLASYVAHVWGKERLVCRKRCQSSLCSYHFYFSGSTNGMWWEICTAPEWTPPGSWGSTDIFAHCVSLLHIVVRDNSVRYFKIAEQWDILTYMIMVAWLWSYSGSLFYRV